MVCFANWVTEQKIVESVGMRSVSFFFACFPSFLSFPFRVQPEYRCRVNRRTQIFTNMIERNDQRLALIE